MFMSAINFYLLMGSAAAKEVCSDSQEGHILLGRGLGPSSASRRQSQVWYQQRWFGR